MNNDLISRKALLYAIEKERQFLLSSGRSVAEHILVHHCLRIIDDAPTVPLPDFKEGYKQAIRDGKTNFSRPQGKWVKSKDGYTRCDQCGSRGSAIKANFCHHCGADMRGVST